MEKKTLREELRGSGGGGKGGGQAQRTPVEMPDSLRSAAKAKVLDLLCEGPIHGLVNGLKSVYLDGVVVQEADGHHNFRDVTLYDVKGEPDQEYIPGFSSATAETPVGAQVLRDSPVVRTITDPAVDAVRLTIRVPALTQQDPNTGDLRGSQVRIRIDLQSNGGGYQEVGFDGATEFKGKATSPYERQFTVQLPKGGAPWDVRVSRLTADSSSSALQNDTHWVSYAAIVDSKLSYPHSAICALQVSAQQFSRVPTRGYEIKGLIIRVPSNYDPETRAYSGTWDGSFKLAWTDNPAWVFYDLLTTERYGLGQFVNAAAVDKWGLYEIAQYCDQLVGDGRGGLEPRFTCNIYIQAQEDAYRVINNLASVFRGMVYWASGTVYVSQDAPHAAEYQFTNANVLDGLFTYSSSGRRARHTVALVTWNDPANGYKQSKAYVEDPDGLASYGFNPTEAVAIGCTSQGQAERVGRWLLYTERLETSVVTFKTGLEGALRSPGAIIRVLDSDRAGRRWGGRVVEGDGTNLSAVELDAEVELDAGLLHTLSCVMPDGTVEARTVGTLPDAPVRVRQLTVTAPFPQTPNGVWVLSSPNLAPETYRVLSVSEAEANVYEVVALRHHAGKYAEVEQGIKVQEPPTSARPSTLPPSGVALSESLYTSASGIKVRMEVRWAAIPQATSYNVWWRPADGNWSTELNVQAHYWELLDVTPGPYDVRVAAVISGFVTSYAEASAVILGKTAPPTDVAGLAVQIRGNGHAATFSWTAAPDLDLDYYEVRRGGTGWTDAAFEARVPKGSTEYQWALPSVPGSWTFRFKAVDTSGNRSLNAASISLNTAPTTPSALTLNITSVPP